ncbi:PELP1 family protein [Megaselia abdita]
MEGLLSVLQSLNKSPNDKAVPQFVKAYSEHQSFQLKNLTTNDGIIQHVTSLMSKPDTRYNGYFILTSAFSQLPLETIEQKSVLWSTLALKACSQKGSDDIAPLAFRLLRLIALQSPNIPELSKSFSNNVVGKISEVIEQSPPSGHLEALKCVETCIITLPGACQSVRGKFEKFILKFIDSTDENLVLWSAKCLHILQKVKGGSVEGLSAKQAWQFYQTKLVGNIHQLLEILFANVTEFYDEPIEKATLKIPPLKLSDEPIARGYQAVTRLNNLVTFLKVALRDPYPVAKQVTPRKVLNVIVRGLSVNYDMLAKNGITDNLIVGAVLPGLQIQLLSLLDTLIGLMGSHMMQHYRVILGIFFDNLKWTETKKSSGKQKPFCNLRIATYKSISLWCSSMKFGSCVEGIADDLFKQIEFDITAFQNELTLQVLSGARKNMSKKARRQLHKSQNESSNMNQKHSSQSGSNKVVFSEEGNQSLCSAALNCLREVLLSSSCFLKPTLIKDIQDRIMSICISLPKHYGNREKLFSSQFTRKALYDVLEGLILANNHMCPPPTQLIIKFISSGSTEDPNERIREFCLNLLRRFEKLIHPQKDCLYFPPSIRDIENMFSRYGRTLGEKKGGNKSEDEEEESDEEGDEEESDEEIEDEVVEKDESEEEGEKEPEHKEEKVPEKTIDLTEEKIVAMEVIESSDEDDCVVTGETRKKEDTEEKEVEENDPEPMQSLVVESDDDNEKDNEPAPSTSEEPAAKKAKPDLRSEAENEALFNEIAATFVDKLAGENSDDDDDDDDDDDE